MAARSRILLVMSEHWPRALLRAELIERGYDAIGAPDLATALHSQPTEKERGPVRVILIDQDALVEPQLRNFNLLTFRHPRARLVLLARAQLETPPGNWHTILRRPLLIGEIATAVEQVAGPSE